MNRMQLEQPWLLTGGLDDTIIQAGNVLESSEAVERMEMETYRRTAHRFAENPEEFTKAAIRWFWANECKLRSQILASHANKVTASMTWLNLKSAIGALQVAAQSYQSAVDEYARLCDVPVRIRRLTLLEREVDDTPTEG